MRYKLMKNSRKTKRNWKR